MNVKVSVIIPIYNMESYLVQCLDSACKQSLSEKEIICIDDGSNDRSYQILLEYKEKYKDIVLTSIENHGVAYARNLGLSMAKGRFCCFLDPDDYYPTLDVLEYLYQIMIEQKVLICGGSAKIKVENHNMELSRIAEMEESYGFHQDGLIPYQEYQYSYGFWRFMYDVKFLKEYEITFPLYSRYQDPPFFVSAMLKAKKFYGVRKASYVYRIGESRTYSYEKTRDALRGMIDVLRMSREHNCMRLHETTIHHIEDGLSLMIYQHVMKGKRDLVHLLLQAKEELDPRLYKGGNFFYIEDKLDDSNSMREDMESFLKCIKQYECLIIYGVGYVGKQVGDYVLRHLSKEQRSNMNIVYGITKKASIIKEEYKGIPIYEISELREYQKISTLVMIATKDNLKQDIGKQLIQEGYENIYEIDYKKFCLYQVFDVEV